MSEDIHKLSDGRYALMFDEHTFFVFDNEEEKRMTALKVTKKLNEQQNTIQFLQNEIDELKKDIDIYEYEEKKHSETVRKLHDENEQLKKLEKINTEYAEQIVEENQKLRIAKNDLRREKEQLQKENEQLRKELDNFRPVMFQDMRKGTVILYTKKFGNNDEVSDGKDAIIQRLALENENLRKQVESSETTSNATSNYNAHLESTITTLEKENEQLQEIVNKLEEAIEKKRI